MADDLARRIAALGAHFGLELDDVVRARLAAYARLVMKWRRVANLTGARNAATFVDEQLADCLSLLPHLEAGRVLDVGSGAGLPGLVLAIAAPRLELTLLEPRQRRARFLTQACIELGLGAVQVVGARLETFRPELPYRYVVSRAVAPLAEFVRACEALRAPGMEIVAMRGALEPADLAAVASAGFGVRTVAVDVPAYARRNLVFCDGGPRTGD